MILLIDNYDSFSYNLVQMVGGICPEICVVRNDKITIEEMEKMRPDHLILSPGPGAPAQAGICEEAVRRLQGKIPILGVCLGHQAICEAYGASIVHAARLMHGKQSQIYLDTESALFRGMDSVIDGARYHSLAADRETIPSALRVTARTEEGEVMAVEHRKYPVFGVQFHPESILTPKGKYILENFIQIKK